MGNQQASFLGNRGRSFNDYVLTIVRQHGTIDFTQRTLLKI
nr:MAG TPA: hypothetical protein [Bacteriophage sp.]